jgi:nitric oxide reductase NorQ protein
MHQQDFCPVRKVKQPVAKAKVERQAGVLNNRLPVPEIDPHYFHKGRHLEEVKRIIAMTEEAPQNLLLVGPAGTGKSVLAEQIAAMRRSPTYEGHAYNWRSSDEIFGQTWVEVQHDEKGQAVTSMTYTPSLFVEAVETEGATIIIHDLPLMQNRSIQNGLNDLLDRQLRRAWIDQIAKVWGRPVQVANGVLFVCTMNEGSEYTGNIKLAQNIKDRFDNQIMVDYPEDEVANNILVARTGVDYATAQKLTGYAAALRRSGQRLDISMRGLLQAARKISLGASFFDALQFSFVDGLPVDQRSMAFAAMEGYLTPADKKAADEAIRNDAWITLDENGEPSQ